MGPDQPLPRAAASPLLCLHWDIMDRLPEIGVRTLLVGGRYDECTPGHLEEMHRRIAGSQLVIIEDASHLCFAEQPQEFNMVINSFMT